MPSCRNCGARLSKFDKDLCPVCGQVHPFEGVNSETIDITSQIDISGFSEGQKVVRHRKTMLLFGLLIGFTGMMFFYLKKKKEAILWLSLNLVLLAGSFLLLFLLAGLNVGLSIAIAFSIVYVINIAITLYHFFKANLKDGEGEFVN